MGRKAAKRAELREEQKRIVERKKAERHEKRLQKTDGYNVTFKVFNLNKFLCQQYQTKLAYEPIVSGYTWRLVKNICAGLGMSDIDPTSEQVAQVIQILESHGLSDVFEKYVENHQGVQQVNLRVLNGAYIILLNSKFNVTKDTPIIQRVVHNEKVKKNDFNRWITTAVEKILEPLGVIDEILLVFKTEHELMLQKEAARKAAAARKEYIKVLAYCQKHELEYPIIKTRYGTYKIHIKDLFKDGAFESAGIRNVAEIEEDGTIVIQYKDAETDLLDMDA